MGVAPAKGDVLVGVWSRGASRVGIGKPKTKKKEEGRREKEEGRREKD
jgi:hypothetical protein